jgi:hypothetical protein
MIGKDYFSRQAATLLKLARITRDSKVAVGLATKAADLQTRFDEAPMIPDASPFPPGIQPDK